MLRRLPVHQHARDHSRQQHDPRAPPDGHREPVHDTVLDDPFPRRGRETSARLPRGRGQMTPDVRRARRRGDGVQQRRTDRTTHLLSGVDGRGGHPGVLRRDARRGRGHHRHEDQAHAEADQQLGRQHVRDVRGLGGQRRQPEQPRRREHRAWHHQHPGRQMVQQPCRYLRRSHNDRRRDRQKRQARLHRRIPQYHLQVVRHEQEHPEHGDDRQRHGQKSTRAIPVPHDVQRQQRMTGPPLPPRENGQQHGPAHQQPDNHRVPPPPGLRLTAPIDDGDQPATSQHHAGHIQPSFAMSPPVVQKDPGSRCRHHRDRHIHVKAPAPVQVLRQQPAGYQPDGRAAARNGAVNPERLAPLFPVREGRRQQRQRGRRQYSSERALQGPGPEQQSLPRRGTTQRRSDRETHQPDDERPLTPHQVGDPPTQQQQPAERERVRRDHPLPVGIRHVQLPLRRRQGDIDDRGIQHHHQLGHGNDDKSPPPPRIRLPSRTRPLPRPTLPLLLILILALAHEYPPPPWTTDNGHPSGEHRSPKPA